MLSLMWYYFLGLFSWEVVPHFNTILKEYFKIMIKLSDYVVKSREPKEIVYDKDWNIKFKLIFISRPELQVMVGKFTKIDFNRVSHAKEEMVESEKLTDAIMDKCVVGWSGINFKWLSTQMLIPSEQIESTEEIPFSQDNLKDLIKESYHIGEWIVDNVKNAANFNEKKAEEIKN